MELPKKLKIISLFLLTLFFCFVSYKLCYFIAEKYFFDKFFYQKSIKHGYEYYSTPFSKYNNRAKDLTILNSKNPQILGVTDKHEFVIVIIGDSYVWGTGLRNEQRFVNILTKKLNRIKPTKIISLGFPGSNILDYVNTYNKYIQSNSANLFIFLAVTNDIFINKTDIDNDLVVFCHKLFPDKTPSFTSDLDEAYLKDPIDYKTDILHEVYEKAWQNPINQCIFDNSLKILPTNNSLFFITEDYEKNQGLAQLYYQYLLTSNKNFISSSVGKNISIYNKYWDNNLWKNFTISPTEGHPNALANKMYADILFNEITTNSKWNFPKN